jgi:hypothetical protein
VILSAERSRRARDPRVATLRALVLIGLGAAQGSCALHRGPTLAPARSAELWEEPVDLERRDLFHGPGGPGNAPRADDVFQMLALKSTGTQPGYDVKDPGGREWGVKLGVEARVETTVSRIVWAVGYHQPFVYYVPRWTLSRDGKDSVHSAARFRLDSPSHRKTSEWSWRSNPFVGTRALNGLFVLMVLVNNGDLKTAQNSMYEVHEPGQEKRTWYMVRDLGASLGKPVWGNFGTKDDPDGFEQVKFIERVEGNRVRFDFADGWIEPHLQTSVTPDDVRWVCQLLSRLSPAQWHDAFRAGGFSEAEAARYIRRLQAKIAEGLKVSWY